jgi:hypothetical protein
MGRAVRESVVEDDDVSEVANSASFESLDIEK